MAFTNRWGGKRKYKMYFYTFFPTINTMQSTNQALVSKPAVSAPSPRMTMFQKMRPGNWKTSKSFLLSSMFSPAEKETLVVICETRRKDRTIGQKEALAQAKKNYRAHIRRNFLAGLSTSSGIMHASIDAAYLAGFSAMGVSFAGAVSSGEPVHILSYGAATVFFAAISYLLIPSSLGAIADEGKASKSRAVPVLSQ
jgi:hypothetical protein